MRHDRTPRSPEAAPTAEDPPEIPSTLFGACVVQGRVDLSITEPVVHHRVSDSWLVADRHRALVDVAGIARFAIADGEQVTVDVEPTAGGAAVSAWMYGTVAALLLGQQGRFALHASTVALDHTAVAVSGTIGSGKSTTSLALVDRGHRLVADDVSPVTMTGRTASVEPFGRPVHVWPTTYAALGMTVPPEARTMPWSGKLGLPAPRGGAVDLGAIVVIRRSNSATAVTMAALSLTDAVQLLTAQSYRASLLRRLWPSESLRWCAAVSERVPTFEVTRPAVGWTAPAVADAVEDVARNLAST